MFMIHKTATPILIQRLVAWRGFVSMVKCRLKAYEGKWVSHHGDKIVNLMCVSVGTQAVPHKGMIWLPAQHIHTTWFCPSYQGVDSSGTRKDLKEHNRNYFRHASWQSVWVCSYAYLVVWLCEGERALPLAEFTISKHAAFFIREKCSSSIIKITWAICASLITDQVFSAHIVTFQDEIMLL